MVGCHRAIHFAPINRVFGHVVADGEFVIRRATCLVAGFDNKGAILGHFAFPAANRFLIKLGGAQIPILISCFGDALGIETDCTVTGTKDLQRLVLQREFLVAKIAVTIPPEWVLHCLARSQLPKVTRPFPGMGDKLAERRAEINQNLSDFKMITLS